MTKEDDYRNNAAEMIQLAQRASSNRDKHRLLNMAEAWLDLADRARNSMRRLRKPSVLHPLVREKIDRRI
jgi:Mg2+ and Co2+ transporter CorA